MDVEIEVPAGARRVLAEKARRIGLVHRALQRFALADELAAHIDVAGVRIHREGSDETALDELLRIVPHDLAVFAGAGLGLVGVDDEIMRTPARILRHEGPLEARREAGATAAAQTRLLHFVDDPVAALGDDRRRAVPVAALERALKTRLAETVEIGEDAILVLKHHWPSPVEVGIEVRLVSAPSGSEPCRPFCGPGFTSRPARSPSITFSSRAASRSS